MEEYRPKYYTMTELTISATAKSYGISNWPNDEHRRNLLALCEHVLDPIREMWGAPIYVSSGYRSLALNNKLRELGNHASPKSQHILGQAADIQTGTVEGNKRLFGMILDSGLPICQMIDEEGCRWIHISFDPAAVRPKRQVLVGRNGRYSDYKR